MASSRYLTDQFGKFLTAPPVKVLVGKDSEVYYIHPDILSSSKSSSADVRMSGAWRYNGDGAVNWTDFDKQTIECVLHYLYTGDYHVPESVEETPAPDREGEEANIEYPEDTPLEDGMSSAHQAESPEGNALEQPLTPISGCLEFGLPEERLRTAAGVVAEKGFKHNDPTVGKSILAHAKVYSFGHCHFFSDLARLALQRLTQILTLAPCNCSSLFPYLADVIRYIYDTTLRRETNDPARTLLSQYIALNYTNLSGEELDALAAEGGEFMVDVTKKLARRMTADAHCVRLLKNQVDSLTTQVSTLETLRKNREDEIEKASIEADNGWGSSFGIANSKGRKR